MLIGDEIVVQIARESVYLRPTLRVCARLESRFGFQQLARDIAEGKLGTYCAIIGEFHHHPFLETQVWEAGIEILQPSLMRFLHALAGGDDSKADTPKDDTPTISHAEYYERLFRFGCGWCGWSPETTWSSTPAEILAAYRGRVDMLRACFGIEEKPQPKSAVPLGEKFKTAFRALGAKIVRKER